MSFVHLHTHSHYSLLDGLSKVKDLVKEAVRMEMPALAITDHGNMYGAIEFYKEAQKAGIKPIIGLEGYVAARSKRRSASSQSIKIFLEKKTFFSKHRIIPIFRITSIFKTRSRNLLAKQELLWSRRRTRITSGRTTPKRRMCF